MKHKRNGPSARVTQVTADVARRLVDVRAMWLAVHNDPDITVQEAASEFYFAVGEILEGKALRQIEFHKIQRERVLDHAREG